MLRKRLRAIFLSSKEDYSKYDALLMLNTWEKRRKRLFISSLSPDARHLVQRIALTIPLWPRVHLVYGGERVKDWSDISWSKNGRHSVPRWSWMREVKRELERRSLLIWNNGFQSGCLAFEVIDEVVASKSISKRVKRIVSLTSKEGNLGWWNTSKFIRWFYNSNKIWMLEWTKWRLVWEKLLRLVKK